MGGLYLLLTSSEGVTQQDENLGEILLPQILLITTYFRRTNHYLDQ